MAMGSHHDQVRLLALRGANDLGAGALLGAALLTQYACTRLWRLPAFDPRSALISGLSLCLLLRANSVWLVVLTAVVTIASKFVIRWRGKHIFNPTNFGIVASSVSVFAASASADSKAFAPLR